MAKKRNSKGMFTNTNSPNDFWNNVEKTPTCWIWKGYLYGLYGGYCYEGKVRLAHRLSYTLTKGSIPKSLILDHLCRNKLCVNPNHLEPVTYAVNIRRGSLAKLTQNDVNRIRLLYRKGIIQKELGKMFKVGQDQISRIINLKRWATA